MLVDDTKLFLKLEQKYLKQSCVPWGNSSADRKKTKLSEGFGVEFQAITEESIGLIKRFIERGITIR